MIMQENVRFRTSGSTGAPKDIDLPVSDIVASAQSTIDFFSLDGNSVLASPLSSEYIAGYMMEVRARVAHARLIKDIPSNRPFESYDFSDIGHIDLLAVVPSQIPSLLENKALLSRLGNVIIGGAPLNRQMEERLLNTGVHAFVTYGMTETASHVALRPVGCEIYRALPGISFATEADGRLIIMAPDRSFRKLVTNDVVELISDTEFRWVGRADNVINTGGIKLHPEVLELKVGKIITNPFYFTGCESELWGTELHLVVEDSEGVLDAVDIGRKLEAVLSRYERPKKIILVDHIERTGTGKILRIK